ncbi:hypothetical protein V496_07951 [Pseudogymnoascus sp. VKM F-4515 (FW-2607)]|nr:hypothetical protein V496_07951 [Pseudogymnoascus sp. VKM F-4515 (FW-2607)]
MRHRITTVLLPQYCHGSSGIFGAAVAANMASGQEALTLPIVFDVMLGPAVRWGLAAAEMSAGRALALWRLCNGQFLCLFLQPSTSNRKIFVHNSKHHVTAQMWSANRQSGRTTGLITPQKGSRNGGCEVESLLPTSDGDKFLISLLK